MLDKKVAIVGYSGHGLVVADAALQSGVNLKYYTERIKSDVNPFHLEYLGDENNFDIDLWEKADQFILGIGDNAIRNKVTELLLRRKKDILNVIHPDSSLSDIVNLGKGNFISRNVSVNAGVSIGNYCIINTGSIIEHECHINDFAHIAPGATLAGNVKIGTNSFVGANAVIKQGVTIGRNVVVGAGAVIVKDIEDNKRFVGNPGRELI